MRPLSVSEYGIAPRNDAQIFRRSRLVHYSTLAPPPLPSPTDQPERHMSCLPTRMCSVHCEDPTPFIYKNKRLREHFGPLREGNAEGFADRNTSLTTNARLLRLSVLGRFDISRKCSNTGGLRVRLGKMQETHFKSQYALLKARHKSLGVLHFHRRPTRLAALLHV